MSRWSYPGGPEKRGENWQPHQRQCTEPRWGKWKRDDVLFGIALFVVLFGSAIGLGILYLHMVPAIVIP